MGAGFGFYRCRARSNVRRREDRFATAIAGHVAQAGGHAFGLNAPGKRQQCQQREPPHQKRADSEISPPLVSPAALTRTFSLSLLVNRKAEPSPIAAPATTSYQ